MVYGLPVPAGGPHAGLYKVAQHVPGPALKTFDPNDPAPFRVDDPMLLEPLRHAVARLLPSLDPQPVATERCVYDNSSDTDFVLQRVGRVVVGCGTSGHAFKFGPLVGELLADLAEGTRPSVDLSRFALARSVRRHTVRGPSPGRLHRCLGTSHCSGASMSPVTGASPWMSCGIVRCSRLHGRHDLHPDRQRPLHDGIQERGQTASAIEQRLADYFGDAPRYSSGAWSSSSASAPRAPTPRRAPTPGVTTSRFWPLPPRRPRWTRSSCRRAGGTSSSSTARRCTCTRRTATPTPSTPARPSNAASASSARPGIGTP